MLENFIKKIAKIYYFYIVKNFEKSIYKASLVWEKNYGANFRLNVNGNLF